MSLRIRRGTDAQRSGITFDQGEIIWTTDSEKLYIGDGVTQGGKNIAAQLAGTGLQWNSEDEVLETEALSFNSDQITEGSNNLYHTSQRAQDATGSLFTTGTHSGISFVYDSVLHKINATVSVSNEVVQDQVASLFTTGIHSGISFVYDDENNRINATVSENPEVVQDIVGAMFDTDPSLHTGISFNYNDANGEMVATVEYQDIYDSLFPFGTLVTDTAPQLSADLDLNENDIVGVGNIDVFGNMFNGSVSVNQNSSITSLAGFLNIGNSSNPTRLEVTTTGSTIASFSSTTNGLLPSGFFVNGYKNSLTSPANFVGEDIISVIAMRGWQPSVNNFVPSFSLYGYFDAGADFLTARPKSKLIISTGSNTNDIPSLGNRYEFDGNGTFSAPLIKTGTFANTVDRDNRAYTATPGTIIFLSSDGSTTEITGSTQVSSGATFDITLSNNVYTPTLDLAGSTYSVGEVLVFNGSQFGGNNSNDLSITVTAITGGGPTGPIDTFTSFGVGINLTETYPNQQQVSTTGIGSGAKFVVTVQDNETYSLLMTSTGTDYAVGNTLTLSGTTLGGTSPANDIVVTVLTIASGGATGPISTYSFTGTAVLLTSTFAGVEPDYTRNTTTLLSADSNVSFIGQTISGLGIPTNTLVTAAVNGISLTFDTETTINYSTTDFVIVATGTARFQGCTAAGSGVPGDPGYVAPTWANLS